MPHEEEQFDSLPPAIIDALRDLDGPVVMHDPHRDADVISGARQHLAGAAQVERKRRNLRLFFAGGAGGAIAAAVAVAFVVFFGDPQHEPLAEQDMYTSSEPNSPVGPGAQAGDLDRNGSVDILDAYALAKQIEQGRSSDQNDFNNDGRIDQGDIDWLANQAVALNTGERG
jgi:hypothetical protein